MMHRVRTNPGNPFLHWKRFSLLQVPISFLPIRLISYEHKRMFMPQEGPTMAERTKQGKSGLSNHTESKPPRATERRDEIWSPVREGIIPLPPSLTVNAAAPSNAETLELDKKKNKLFEAIVDQHIGSVLYGPRKMRRLEVFKEICPE